MPYACVKLFAKPNHGRHRCDRNKTGRNNCVADQSVEQGGFASLELTDDKLHRNVLRKPALRDHVLPRRQAQPQVPEPDRPVATDGRRHP